MKKNDKPAKAELHKEAEARLKKPKKTAKPLTSEAETQRLIHELEVSQIELEMQNEELTQTRTDLESALRQYTDLYDFAPVGYYSLTRDGMIREANLAGKNLLGLEGKHSARHRLGAFVSHESLPAFNIFWGKLLSGQGKETCDLALETRKGRMLWGHLEATCFEGSEVSRIAITDITERKIAEDYLEKFKQIVASTSEGISLLDTNYRYVIVNKAYETFSNKRKEELIGITVAEYLGEAVFYEHIKPQFDKCLNGETIRYLSLEFKAH